MRVVKKNVYYCSFCNKYKLTSQAMKLHEEHCTANHNRSCRLCGRQDGVLKVDPPAVVKKETIGVFDHIEIEDKHEEDTYTKIRKWSGGCPACILAAIKLNGIWPDFDYIEESKRYYATNRRYARECEGDDGGGFLL